MSSTGGVAIGPGGGVSFRADLARNLLDRQRIAAEPARTGAINFKGDLLAIASPDNPLALRKTARAVHNAAQQMKLAGDPTNKVISNVQAREQRNTVTSGAEQPYVSLDPHDYESGGVLGSETAAPYINKDPTPYTNLGKLTGNAGNVPPVDPSSPLDGSTGTQILVVVGLALVIAVAIYAVAE